MKIIIKEKAYLCDSCILCWNPNEDYFCCMSGRITKLVTRVNSCNRYTPFNTVDIPYRFEKVAWTLDPKNKLGFQPPKKDKYD